MSLELDVVGGLVATLISGLVVTHMATMSFILIGAFVLISYEMM